MHSGTVYWISNFILTVFWMVSASIILEPRFSRKLTIFLEVVIHFLWWYLSENYIEIFSVARFALEIIVLIAILVFFHKDSIIFKTLTAFLFMISLGLAELLLASLLPWDMVVSGELFEKNAISVYSIYLFVNLFLLLIIVFALTAYKKKYQDLLPIRQRLLFLLFPFSQIVSISGWTNAFAAKDYFVSPVRTIVVVLLFILADISLFFLLKKTAENAVLESQNKFLAEQISADEKHYADITSTFEEIRKMRHDIDNHLYTMKALIEDDKVSQATEYVQTVIHQDRANIEFPDCKNSILASYLAKKKEDLTKQGIETKFDIHIPKELKITNPDLICVFGNILDNAAEAVTKKPDPKILVKTSYKDPYLSIHCENRFEPDAAKHERIKGLQRGIGLSILDTICKRYDGQFMTKEENGIFYTDLVMKNTERN